MLIIPSNPSLAYNPDIEEKVLKLEENNRKLEEKVNNYIQKAETVKTSDQDYPAIALIPAKVDFAVP